MSNKSYSKRKWAIDLSNKKVESLPSPPGYISSVTQVASVENSRQTDPSLIIKKAWDLALSPLKTVPMNLFIMYMAGNTISIFPIMMIGMMVMRPIKALFATSTTFKAIEGINAPLQKLIYLLGNLVNIGLALYKCQSMGLLPTHASDWLAFQDPVQQMEFSHGGILLT